MATYQYKCTNKNCTQNEVLKDVNIPIKEYSEDKLPLCEECAEKTSRNYTANGHQSFGDGYKG